MTLAPGMREATVRLALPEDGISDGAVTLRVPTAADIDGMMPALADPELREAGNLPDLSRAEMEATIPHLPALMASLAPPARGARQAARGAERGRDPGRGRAQLAAEAPGGGRRDAVGRAGQPDRADDRARVVGHRGRDAPQPRLELLAVGGPALGPDLGELLEQRRDRADRVRRAPLERAAAVAAADLGVGQRREQRLADRGRVRGRALAHRRVHPHAAPPVDDGDRHDLDPVEHRDVAGLAAPGDEAFEDRAPRPAAARRRRAASAASPSSFAPRR